MRVKAKTVSENEAGDPVFISSMIERVRIEELEPYLSLPSVPEPIIAKLNVTSETKGSKLYPNPTSALLSIVAGNNFADGMPILITVYDLNGKVQHSQAKPYSLGKVIDLNLEQLTDGLYIMELSQGERMERHKVVKRAGK